MDLEVKGISASSRGQAQLSSRGKKLSQGWRPNTRAARPPEVPCLDLGRLGDSDEEDGDTYIPYSKGYPCNGRTDSSSTVSWGSPLQTPYAQHFQTQQMPDKPCQKKMEDPQPEDRIGEDLTALDEKALLQQCYTSNPYNIQQSIKKLEADDTAAEKRKQTVVEQVMVDQLCRNGRDACRELIGFFFTCDGSLTVYEYRQFGKNRVLT